MQFCLADERKIDYSYKVKNILEIWSKEAQRPSDPGRVQRATTAKSQIIFRANRFLNGKRCKQ